MVRRPRRTKEVHHVPDHLFCPVRRRSGRRRRLRARRFLATWCGPCKMLAPTLDQVAAEVAGRAKVVKVDIDASPDRRSASESISVPTLAVFKDGKLVNQTVGVQPKPAIMVVFPNL
ncbi:MAG: thioredoxin domain-containing protein, partial [Senegalimassilia anaerobia]